jgi:hypothetical protein
MRTKDQLLLEQAYQNILEGKEAPCPCTVGKKCKKDKCPCTKCKKAKTKMMKEDQDGSVEGLDPLSDPQMQEAMAILQQYAQGDITNTEAAKMFKDLYEKGVQSGPTQDDMYYTDSH